MNTLSPGFSKQLVDKVKDYKKTVEPVGQKISLSKDMEAFLSNKTSTGFYKDEGAGFYLKCEKRWSTKKMMKPINLDMTLHLAQEFKPKNKNIQSRTMDEEKSAHK